MQLNRLRQVVTVVFAGAIVIGACSSDSNSPNANVVDLVSCPPTVAGGDNLGRAFYLDSFPGSTLESVTSYFQAVGSGDRTVALTARNATFDGAVIGTDTVSFSAADGDSSIAVLFDLGGNAVTEGSIVTFAYGTIADTGGTLFMQTTTSNATCPIVQTNGSTPPLDTDRRNGLAVVIRGEE